MSLKSPVFLQLRLQPVEIAERLVHVGLVHLDIAHVDHRIARDDALVGILADHLRVDRDVLRHVDDEVAQDAASSRRGGAPASGRASRRSASPWR